MDDDADRRSSFRRQADRDLHDQLDALNFVIFGDRRVPESGIVNQLIRLDRRIDQHLSRIERRQNVVLAAALGAMLTFAGAIVQGALFP